MTPKESDKIFSVNEVIAILEKVKNHNRMKPHSFVKLTIDNEIEQIKQKYTTINDTQK